MAKWLDASASLRRPVSGDFATTANFALVVSGVPTRGEKTNASGASGAERVHLGRGEPVQQPGAEPGAADAAAQDRLREIEALGVAAAHVHDERAAEVAARRHRAIAP